MRTIARYIFLSVILLKSEDGSIAGSISRETSHDCGCRPHRPQDALVQRLRNSPYCTAATLVLQAPRAFRWAVGGSFPSYPNPLAQLNAVRAVPLLLIQGRDSQYYPVDSLCDDLRLCHAAGLSVSVRHYPAGDELTTQMLHDLNMWMMEIVTGNPTGPRHPPVAPVDSN